MCSSLPQWRYRQSSSDGFKAFMAWIASERDSRDRENRTPGQENKTSEAEALTTILEQVEFGKDGERVKSAQVAMFGER
jgi:hypothetical protein